MVHAKISEKAVSPKAKIPVHVQLIVFFVLSFVIAWLAWLPAMLNPMAPQPLSILGLFAPAMSAVIVVWWAQGKAGVVALFKRYTIWRFSIGWYLLALLLMPTIYMIALVVTLLSTHGSFSNLFFANSPLFILVAYVYLMVINSGEEIGWRGFALPLLQSVLPGPVTAGLMLGLIWGLWHLPLYINPEVATMPYPLFLVLTVGLSLIYTHLFNRSTGSLWTVVMLHAATDVLPRILQLAQVGLQFWVVTTILVWLVALGLSFLLRNTTPVIGPYIERKGEPIGRIHTTTYEVQLFAGNDIKHRQVVVLGPNSPTS
ncbi:CPBP family intramembrane glutamic endopeptidase [Ktedonobacter sp. SOSP1-52]|uniref:CPBP family intramembrane glutamic endopeptidase n=1 Tax=Ktedonobacter sp. SOSP1-52 TaxID=2778366 RepID=UPI0019153CB1|nr:CPBP family intramembrane glutamic endopeptidase [Ktedonobacter sp. SOSP1-52]